MQHYMDLVSSTDEGELWECPDCQRVIYFGINPMSMWIKCLGDTHYHHIYRRRFLSRQLIDPAERIDPDTWNELIAGLDVEDI